MFTLSLFTHSNGKPFNVLMVRPSEKLIRQELDAIAAMETVRIIGWQLHDKTGICDSYNSSQVLPNDSRAFDSYDVSYWARY